MSEAKSLIEYALQKVQVTTLNYHYRSTKKELINFSNSVFYNGTLNVCDAPDKKIAGLHLVDVKGSNVNGVNEQEANEIIKQIESIVSKPDHGSIGVITLTQEQSEYIIQKLKSSSNQMVLNELSKTEAETGHDISLFVKTIADVQGEERDNIFISCV
jgi:superfamily I DNA and/or RNA helicase